MVGLLFLLERAGEGGHRDGEWVVELAVHSQGNNREIKGVLSWELAPYVTTFRG